MPFHHVFKPKRCAALFLALSLLVASTAGLAQSAGEIEFARGVGFAQSAGQLPRTLGKGLSLQEGDRLTTSDNSTAIVRLQDGTRMTVRPNSDLVLQEYRFKENASNNSMVLQLFRGGFRALTGLISKNSPNAARIQTSTATIGIRGTDFDARLCAKECGAESARVTERARPNAVQASARVWALRGEISAVDTAGQRRRLVDGGSVYPGDLVETGAATQAMLAFRDESRVLMGATTRFRIDNFVYDQKNAGEGRFLVSLLKGTVRALSGLIAKTNNRNVGFSTSTATIGIRGTELSLTCTGECAGEAAIEGGGLAVFTYSGAVSVTPQCQPSEEQLLAGFGLNLAQCRTRQITNPPLGDLPSPSLQTVPSNLFYGDTVDENGEGLYVYVRDGHIEITSNNNILHLGRGETGFSNEDGYVARPGVVPRFIDFDRTPLPASRNPALVSALLDAGVRAGGQCR
jgi:hypothetical protein